MKSDRILLYLGLILIMTFTSCKDEFFKYDGTKVVEGLPASVILGFESQENTIVTRAERDSIYENRVDNIYVFIFDSQGNVHERKFCTQGNGLSYTGNSSDKGTLQINTTSLNNAKIVGIANVSVQGVTSTAYSITQEDLDGVRSLQELENMVMTMTDNSVERYAIFMMTGFAKHEDENGNWVTSVTIPGTEDGQATLDCTLQLERTDAKVKFVVTTDNVHGYTDFSFSPRNWTVKRVPSQSYILPKSEGDYDGQDAKYFTSLERPFEVITRDVTNPKLDAGGSFVFYMPENRKSPKTEITREGNETNEQLYALREKWNGNDDEGDKVFTNANDNSTYVEMTGLLSYNDPNNDNKNTNADIKLIVHLGNPKEKDDGSYDVNNYNTNRNTFYTYNIIIRGVEDIKVEVSSEQGEELRPGYEGDVVDTENKAFVFDSHYDRCLIKIKPSDIPQEGEIYWSINTPFSRGVHTVTNAEVEENLRDYRWIKFAVNAEYGVPEDQYVKYPGDQNYNDPYPFTDQENDKPSPYYSNEGYSAGDSNILGRPYDSSKARLLDINQLMVYLRELGKTEKDWGEEGITITTFVDENLYFKHPITGEQTGRSLWKLTSDKEDRILYLVITKPKYSLDGNSSVVVAEYSFRQRTIRTIFNVDHPDLQTAWGLESVMETKRLQSGDGYNNQANDTRNGRNNCLIWLRGKKWTDIINVSSEEGYVLKDPYNNAAFACMLRNRDLNGDNTIDDREVRWYLASIDQLTDIFLGEYALDEQSRLYPSNAADRENMVRWHYVSSSYNNGDKKPWVLWAEEGASKGSYSNSNSAMGGLYNYRCVRNLGISLDKPDENPTDLVQVKDENDGFCLIDMSYMNEKARRNSYVTVLPLHNERSDVNRPYTKFRVHKNCYGGDGETPHLDRWISNEWNDWPWSHYQTFSGYPEEAKGYRVPNQRELLIMSSRMDERYWPTFEDDGRKIKPSYVSQTAFSLKGHQPEYDNNREGFLWSSDSKNFFLQNSKSDEGYVRPVQDVR